MIPYGRQNISKEDIRSVEDVLKSDYLTQGPVVPKFEETVANYCKAQYSVAVCNATSALHVACLALGVGNGDLVWTSPISFVASANCALYCGAKVDFVDIDPLTYNMSVDRLSEKLEFAKKKDKLPKVVIPVHLCGQPCDMAKIHELSQIFGFRIIEDASHAIGAEYNQEPVGNCRYSDITVFSFHPVKIVTSGEGGMALTNIAQLAEKMKLLRSHGITRDASEMTREPEGPWYYEQIELGFNYRMTDIQAALGVSQMKRLPEFLSKRQIIADRFYDLLAEFPMKLPWQNPSSKSSYHLYVIRLNLEDIKLSHREVFDALRSAGIGVNLHYIPIYRQPYFERMGYDRDDFPEAESYYSEAISLPIYPDLEEVQQDRVISALENVLDR